VSVYIKGAQLVVMQQNPLSSRHGRTLGPQAESYNEIHGNVRLKVNVPFRNLWITD
jgi:hypothetical protein